MIDPRIYRAALIPVLLAFVLLAFSLENRPQPMRTALAPDEFRGERAFDRAYEAGEGLSDRFAQRRPGSAGDDGLASEIADEMKVRIETVSFHLGNIYRKLHVRTRSEAILKYMGRAADT